MGNRETPARREAFLAYVISALTALLWVACVLPAGEIANPAAGDDAATPIHREPILIVPALLLLIAIPAGVVLARRLHGMRAVLASTDAFVAIYVAIALWTKGVVQDPPMIGAVILLFLLGGLSIAEVHRQTTSAEGNPPPLLSGARLGICLLVLILPLHVLLRPDVERASLLAPFLFVALSAGGARLARGMLGLRRTAGVLQLLLAAHLLITLRYTIHRTEPTLAHVGPTGDVALGLGIAVVAATVVQLGLMLRRPPGTDEARAAA